MDGRTHRHKGDFILCPMLCIVLDRQKITCVIFIAASQRTIYNFNLVMHSNVCEYL